MRFDQIPITEDVRRVITYLAAQDGIRVEGLEEEDPEGYLQGFAEKIVDEHRLEWGSKVRIDWAGDPEVGYAGETDVGYVVGLPGMGHGDDPVLSGFVFIPRPTTFPGDRGEMPSEWRTFYELVFNDQVERIVCL